MKNIIAKELKAFNSRAGEYFSEIIANWQLLLIFLLFWTGIFTGAKLSVNSDFMTGTMTEFIEKALAVRHSAGILQVLGVTFAFNVVFSAVLFISGLCAVGLPLAAAAPCIAGITVGILSGFLCSAHGMQGIGYSLLLVMPATVLSGVVLIFACRDSFIMSGEIIRSIAGNSGGNGREVLKNYLLRYGIYIVIFALISLLNALLSKAFIDLFVF